jgi:tRNA(adenine34) deaminase
MPDYHQLIKQQYLNTRGDSTELFNLILQASKEIGMDQALACVEQCVIEKRLAWLKENRGETVRADDPLTEGYHWFYERYLRVALPADGEIIEQTDKRLVMRWCNPCPTLEACQKLGLDTREVCEKAYERPVGEFLKAIHPKLRFERNYEHIRPYSAFCEEIILLDD